MGCHDALTFQDKNNFKSFFTVSYVTSWYVIEWTFTVDSVNENQWPDEEEIVVTTICAYMHFYLVLMQNFPLFCCMSADQQHPHCCTNDMRLSHVSYSKNETELSITYTHDSIAAKKIVWARCFGRASLANTMPTMKAETITPVTLCMHMTKIASGHFWVNERESYLWKVKLYILMGHGRKKYKPYTNFFWSTILRNLRLVWLIIKSIA